MAIVLGDVTNLSRHPPCRVPVDGCLTARTRTTYGSTDSSRAPAGRTPTLGSLGNQNRRCRLREPLTAVQLIAESSPFAPSLCPSSQGGWGSFHWPTGWRLPKASSCGLSCCVGCLPGFAVSQRAANSLNFRRHRRSCLPARPPTPCLLEDGSLRAVHEATQRIEDVFLGVQQRVFSACQFSQEPIGFLLAMSFKVASTGVSTLKNGNCAFWPCRWPVRFQAPSARRSSREQVPGLVAAGGLVKEVCKEVLQRTHLRGAELHLRLQHQGRMGVGVARLRSSASRSSELLSCRTSTLPRAHSSAKLHRMAA